MSYLLSGSEIRNPHEMSESTITQVAQQKTLSGRVGRDYFGSSKRIWVLNYKNVNKNDYNAIKAIYDTYLDTSLAVAWEVTETNYPVTATTVHIDLVEREFRVRGEDYLSDFNLILTEA